MEDWIWKDNMNFIQDRNIFDHTYFNFMWQMVSYIPTTFTEAPAAPAVPPAELPAASGSAAAAAANAGGSSGSSSSSGYSVTSASRLENQDEDVTLLSAKLATSFFLESFIHSKEKLNIVQWVELLTKKFDSSAAACRYYLH